MTVGTGLAMRPRLILELHLEGVGEDMKGGRETNLLQGLGGAEGGGGGGRRWR